MIFDRFLFRFGCVLAPFLAPKLASNRPKIGPRRLLRPSFLKNVDFHLSCKQLVLEDLGENRTDGIESVRA